MSGQTRLHTHPLALSLRHVLLLLLGATLFAIIVAGCGGGEVKHVAAKPERAYAMADVANNAAVSFPSYVTAAMRESYEYAVQHPDRLQNIPCYCGCGLTAGHKNNLDCYIAGVDKDSRVVFDNHASFCDICLEITQDVSRLSAEGKSMQEIRAYVDQTHGEKGPGTDTPKP